MSSELVKLFKDAIEYWAHDASERVVLDRAFALQLLEALELGAEPATCPVCKGIGKRKVTSFADPSKEIEQSCSVCKGRGQLNQERTELGAAGEPVVLQLPPLTDLMYHAVCGSEYHFSSGGPDAVAGYLDDDCLDDIWDNINTALRVANVARPAPILDLDADAKDYHAAQAEFRAGYLACRADADRKIDQAIAASFPGQSIEVALKAQSAIASLDPDAKRPT